MSWIYDPKLRAWTYRVVSAGATLLAFYGVISNESLPLWLGLAAGVLGNGLAAANTTTRPKDSEV